MHQPKAMISVRRNRRRSRLARRLLPFAASLLLGTLSGNMPLAKSAGQLAGTNLALARPMVQATDFEVSLRSLYDEIAPEQAGLRYEVFHDAMVGYLNLRREGRLDANRKLLTIVDFEQSSTQKRLYIVDLAQKCLVYNTLVAHGQGSGGDLANRFSNEPDSHMSSLGFFVTGEPYTGKHGLSLHLLGQDEGFNSNAFSRSVVMHGADYVSEEFVRTHGRLGRSHGCPALPSELTEPIVNLLQGGTCLFLYSPVERLESRLLNKDLAIAAYFAGERTI